MGWRFDPNPGYLTIRLARNPCTSRRGYGGCAGSSSYRNDGNSLRVISSVPFHADELTAVPGGPASHLEFRPFPPLSAARKARAANYSRDPNQPVTPANQPDTSKGLFQLGIDSIDAKFQAFLNGLKL